MNTLKGKRILVTGAEGFIGSHLVERLLSEGARVRALVQYNSLSSLGWLHEIRNHESIEYVFGDVRDKSFCNTIHADIDLVFHLAALIAIPYSFIAPQSYVDTNVSGTLNICQAALNNGVSRLIQISTSEVYGTAKYVPIDENHPLQPQSPYSASKIAADAIAHSFYSSFDLPVTIARPFNTYGPRQSARAVIPTIISQIASGQKVIKLGDTTPTRDFNYVSDTCNGLVSLACTDEAIGEVVNIGSNFEISIGDTLNLVKKLMNSDTIFELDSKRLRPDNAEVQRLWCNNQKIKAMTSFEPKVSLEDGLKKTIEWFSKASNLAKYHADTYNV